MGLFDFVKNAGKSLFGSSDANAAEAIAKEVEEGMSKMAEVFGDKFRGGLWKGAVPSGPGSTLEATLLLRNQLREVLEDHEIKSLCDAPCGDGTWILEVTGTLDLYLGVDIVPEAIAANQTRNLPLTHFFRVGDITTSPLPRVDAIFCRDCLVHFPLQIAMDTMRLFKQSGSRLLITTTFPKREKNIEATLGDWRPLNLQAAPFNLPPPIALLRERAENSADKYNDKAVGIWRLSDVLS
jgi:SAM-dependent methyltransferase